MEKQSLERIEILLQIIADELYVARTDREFEGASGGGPDMWFERGGRLEMIRGIEHRRETLAKSA